MRRRVPMTAALSIAFALTAVAPRAATGDPAPPPPAAGRNDAPAANGPRAAVVFHPPVDAPIVDPFRPPATPYGPGNRGVDYATTPGGPVRAAAAGVVTFAGQVGGTLNVVVLHDDAIRTTYAALATIAVAQGQRVGAGQILGTSGADLHFGARAGHAYVDPQVLLLAPGTGRARLLPVLGSGR